MDLNSWRKNAEYDEEDMVYCNHCSDIVGNEKEVYGDETVDYEMANGELVCIPCYKIWMKEYKNDLDPHYSPFYAESFDAETEGYCDWCERKFDDGLYEGDNWWDGEELCLNCYQDVYSDFGDVEWNAESKESVNQSITSNKIGESLAWDNRILGMAGQWRNGKYDIYSIRQDADIIGYTIVHKDYLEKKLDWMENGVQIKDHNLTKNFPFVICRNTPKIDPNKCVSN